ncbi:hypothetical protein HCBG_01983 [Histoplasma capsulatum G186AR]|uniref:Uncharacterized protein n=1 Tax=Ajellomyces capsulatus (strain G186AR / H82 / ATCC MYA-2454 / RMSCC 2432) TaxID=447093 RepID=C0NDP0_AJECG|nr:uncharacterized protein HCBG_01983 [Histoplasma capsulatum G186AR]EEH10338.1 hypothetical protein HCBG_01983 [Histoplasma capsulatum G186AR]
MGEAVDMFAEARIGDHVAKSNPMALQYSKSCQAERKGRSKPTALWYMDPAPMLTKAPSWQTK